MIIVEPRVELWENTDKVAHVARCARVCYAKDTGDDKHLYEALKKNKHNSMFRHHTQYYMVPVKGDSPVINIIKSMFDTICLDDTKLIGVDIKKDTPYYYVVLNGNYIIDHPYIASILEPYEVASNCFANTETGFNMMRYTFAVTTQISTSRELNRVSPNSIAEQSTRYVYENGILCRPHWITPEDVRQYKKSTNISDLNNPAQIYLDNCEHQFNVYRTLVDSGVHRQDARGVLPLDTATKCIYTYSIEEWRHILDLRYYGTTGTPHKNAEIIAGFIKNELEEVGYEFNK